MNLFFTWVKRTLTFLPLWFPLSLQAQNLVPNPGFEEMIQCPMEIAHGESYIGQVLKNWQCVAGTADPFNTCNTSPYLAGSSNCQVPLHWILGRSFQHPRNGNGYSGILIGISLAKTSSEAIQVQLTDTLTRNRVYEVTYYIALTDASGFSTGEVGLYLSPDSIHSDYNRRFNNISPQLKPSKNLDDTANWEKVSMLYRAGGDEEWLIIGRFDTSSVPADIVYLDNEVYPFYAYYYIDDVSVVEFSGIFTPFPDGFICLGEAAELTAIVYDRFYWSSNREGTDTISTDSIYSFAPSKNTWIYLVTAQHVDSLWVEVKQPPDFSLPTDTSKCFYDSLNLFPSGQGIYEWSWNNKNTSKYFTARQAGVYSLTASDGQCTTTKKIQVTDFPSTYPLLSPDTALCFEDGESLTLRSAEAVDYLWEPSYETTQQITVWNAGTFSIYISDMYGCNYGDSIHVYDICDYPVFIPNAFSPGSNDNLNGTFTISVRDAVEYELIIYNRWGEELFRSTDSNIGWDGTFKNVPCPEETYMYVLRCRQANVKKTGGMKVYSGTIHLLR